jgi:hypothetical protein
MQPLKWSSAMQVVRSYLLFLNLILRVMSVHMHQGIPNGFFPVWFGDQNSVEIVTSFLHVC